MAKKQQEIEFPFYQYLQQFINIERTKVYTTFTPLTRKFLDFNNPKKGETYLRQPQFEALEMYIFLKEFSNNQNLSTVFQNWFYKTEEFKDRLQMGLTDAKTGQIGIFSIVEADVSEDAALFKDVFKQIEAFKQIYPNYIFALTMGLGKTVLMATCIFYEFLLANKYPKDARYCHNALVFAPDKTVLQSLREIQTFDKSKVIPPEYANWLDANLKFFFLDDTGDALNAIENSMFNIIISNTQKIILKKQHKTKSASEELFADYSKKYKAQSLNKDFEDLYGFDIDTDIDLITNQRFAKLTRLKQLGIYVDEAHHVFGKALADDLFNVNKTTSLRFTINELAANLKNAGSHVVACYNYTGTPYVGSRLLPEVVYAYGLKEAISQKFLKKVNISGFQNIKDQTLAFVRVAIKEFWEACGTERYEGMLPKIAFFASSISELETELRPAIEEVLVEMNISTEKILVNVGDDKITSNDDIREFNALDTPTSEKQFILLVNKGKEGWNCRSLFAVGLHREPKSKIFVLQASMRCLRMITDTQQTGMVFLSDENIRTLNDELEGNFRLSVEDLKNAGNDNHKVQVRLVPPPVKIRLKRRRTLHQIKEKNVAETISLNLKGADTERYKILRSERSIYDLTKKLTADKDVSHIKEQRIFSGLTLVSEIARYLNFSPLRVRKILTQTDEGIEVIVNAVNEYNELLYDWVIPRLFNELFELIEFKTEEEIELELVKEPKGKEYYEFSAKKDLVAYLYDIKYKGFAQKSFHLDNYCFDSNPENSLFWSMLNDKKIEKVWFTGMFTHGQTDFVVNYIDPLSHTVRNYYPDFLVKSVDGSYIIVEVKGDNMVDDAIVQAKVQAASQLALASGMTYKLIKGSEAMAGVGILDY